MLGIVDFFTLLGTSVLSTLSPVSLLFCAFACSVVIILFAFLFMRRRLRGAVHELKQADEQLKQLRKGIETERKDAFLKLKEELQRKRKEFDLELKKDRIELDRAQAKLNVRVEHLESLERQSESNKIELQQRERSLLQAEDRHRANEVKLKKVYGEAIAKLEQVSGFSQDEARRELFHMIEAEARLSSQKTVQKIEEEARQTGKDTAVNILVTAMQRYTADYVSQYSSAVITLPSEDMKGRIIGKEGRNIKALELATGMEFLIGDSQDITISGFNPVRREVARRSLERLISDGRINPTRIEETVGVVEKELDEIIQEEGHATVLEFNLQGIHPDVVTLLGKLYFRTSYTQNVLVHSKEVARFAAMIAEELGLDGSIALRAGLLHDLGKAITAEVEGPHAIIGGDIARRCGEDARIVNAIAAHHEEVPYESIYAPIVIIADMISASRPGARRETLTAYVKRLERLEDIAHSFEGIKRAYALQAGREIRIIVEEEQVGDDQSVILASSIARKIEQEMNFPGQIKVNVIREKRSIAYAK